MANPEQQVVNPARGGWHFIIFAMLLAVGLAGVLFVMRYSIKDGHAADVENSDANSLLFANWTKPDVAIALTGQMHGYLQPCGCSRPQFGGLARRYNYIETLKKKGWPVVAVDLGDVAQTSGAVFEQRQLKYATAMKALDLMGYTAVGLGTHEFAYPLFQILSEYSLNNPTPVVVAANLLKRKPGELFHNLNVKSYALATPDKAPKVGVVGLISPAVIGQIQDPDAKFSENNPAALEQALIDLKAQKAEINVLLYQGPFAQAKLAAEYCEGRAAAYPQIVPALDVVLCLSEASEPPSLAQRVGVGRTMIIEIGHKGRYVGVVGVYGAGPKRRLEYQLVPIGEEYEAEHNAVKDLMEQYAKEVKRSNFIERFPRTKHPLHVDFPQARYVGSATCGDCHDHAYKVWQGSKHSDAFQRLKQAHDPSLREFDGECVKCHVVGFGYYTGYLDRKHIDAKNFARMNKKLENVGCETCHGPGSAHVANPGDTKLHALMNPYKTNLPNISASLLKHRLTLIDMSCQKCHDQDNDVHWTFDKWTQIAHPTPRPANEKAAPAEKAKE